MKARKIAVCVAVFALCLSLTAAATDVAALFPAIRPYSGFSDVAESHWSYQNIKLCYETGLFSGTGGGAFHPAGTVTVAEAATVAARIHHILSGGNGVLPSAPVDRGTVAFLDEAGNVYPHLTLLDSIGWTQGAGVLYMEFPSTVGDRPLPERLTLALGDNRYPGRHQIITGGKILDSDPWEGYVFNTGGEDSGSLYEALIFQATKDNEFSSIKDKWYADTYWYLWMNYHVFASVPLPSWPEEVATREELLFLLAAVTPADLLPAINHISALPDAGDPDILLFYRAGILTGTDAYGTFSGSRSLTRAELAAMVSRIVRPSLRIRFAPAER